MMQLPPPCAPDRYAALLEGMDAELKAVEAQIEVVALILGPKVMCLETKHDGHSSRVTLPDMGNSIATLKTAIGSAIAMHARRLPKHREFAAMGRTVAA
jgi:hypothetical protein